MKTTPKEFLELKYGFKPAADIRLYNPDEHGEKFYHCELEEILREFYMINTVEDISTAFNIDTDKYTFIDNKRGLVIGTYYEKL